MKSQNFQTFSKLFATFKKNANCSLFETKGFIHRNLIVQPEGRGLFIENEKSKNRKKCLKFFDETSSLNKDIKKVQFVQFIGGRKLIVSEKIHAVQ